ncbi:hypothetical protein V2W45_1496344 [Cenococcum geophilum]
MVSTPENNAYSGKQLKECTTRPPSGNPEFPPASHSNNDNPRTDITYGLVMCGGDFSVDDMPTQVVPFIKIITRLSLAIACPDPESLFSPTPLTVAAENGHGAVVRLLLGQYDVNPDAKDDRGQTPLWYVARKGHESVRLLLEQNGVDPNGMDDQVKAALR